MSQVERFFHIHHIAGCTKGGLTVRVVGDTAKVGTVDVQVAECSRKDNFCKKTGREQAVKAPTKVVPLRFLSAELSRIVADGVKHKRIKHNVMSDFTFAIKYFLPKE